MECARVRKKVCYAFADVQLGDEHDLPESGVPESIPQSAVEMPEAEHFEPSFDRVAKQREPSARDEHEVVEAEDETPIGETEAAGDERKLQSCDHEQLLGLDEGQAEDPLAQVLLLQKRLQVAADEGRRLLLRQQRYNAAAGNNDADLVAINAGVEQCKQHFVDLQDICRRIPPDFVDTVANKYPDNDNTKKAFPTKIDDAMHRWRQSVDGANGEARSVAERPGVDAAADQKPVGVDVKAGEPLSMFDPLSWVYSFVEFFYGDCLPSDPRRGKQRFFSK